MADARVLTANTQSVTVNHSASRKRKQNMPPPASHITDVKSSSSAINHEPSQTNLQVSTDKSLQASIGGVLFCYDYPEELVRSCALDMVHRGLPVTSDELLKYIEVHCQPEVLQLESYNDRLNAAGNSDFSEAEPLNSLSESPRSLSQYALSASASFTPSASAFGASESSSTAISSFQSANSYHSSSPHASRLRPNRPRRGSSSENTVSYLLTSPSLPIPTENRDTTDIEEDCVDGHILLSGSAVNDSPNASKLTSAAAPASCVKSNDSVQSSLPQGTTLSAPNRTLNGLSKSSNLSYIASLATGEPKNLVSNQTRQISESPSRPHPGESSVNETDKRAILSFVESSSKDASTVKRSDSENITEPGTSRQERTHRRSERDLPRPLVQDESQYINTCARLVEMEHLLLEKSRLCSMCKVKPRDVTFLPCGHFTVCRGCAEPIYECPSCSKSILATVDTYLS